MKKATRNSEVLQDFMHYCITHPEQRFWQALRNWSCFQSILVSHRFIEDEKLLNTFYWEGKTE